MGNTIGTDVESNSQRVRNILSLTSLTSTIYNSNKDNTSGNENSKYKFGNNIDKYNPTYKNTTNLENTVSLKLRGGYRKKKLSYKKKTTKKKKSLNKKLNKILKNKK